MADNEAVYGLTKDGFRRKRLPEILADINKRVADRLGVEIQTGSNSLLGQLHGVYAYEIADLWEQAEDVYNAMYPNTATGVSLSNAARLAGIVPVSGTKSTLSATCYGTDGTRIPYGTQISSAAQNGSTWGCAETDATISKEKAVYAALEIKSKVTAGSTYSLTLNDSTSVYVTTEQENVVTIFNALATKLAQEGIRTSIDNNVLSVRATNKNAVFSIDAKGITLTRIGSLIRFACTSIGAINPNIGTVTHIVTTVPGWSAVNNEYATNVGQEAESDIMLRQRWNQSLYNRAAAMTDAIAASIKNDVSGVTACMVYENTSDTVDSDGRPPHSVEVVVDGGDDQAVAQKIWKTKAGGIDTYGKVHNIVMDSMGMPHTLYFNRPEQIKIWMKIVISENPDEKLPPSAVSDVAFAVLKKGQSQVIGEDVVLQRYFSTIFQATSGIGYISLTAAYGDTAKTYSTNNITISQRQVAVFNASRIEVTRQ